MSSVPATGYSVAEIYRRTSWKAIPYTELRAMLPALALAAVNAPNFLSPVAQLGAVMLVLAVGFRHLDFDRTGLPLLIYAGIGLGLGFLHYGAHQAVIKGAKLMLFCLASCLSVRGAVAGNSFPALLALRLFLVLCAANLAFAAASGGPIFRSAFLIEFCIYSSYTIAFLIHLARTKLTILDRLAAYGFCVLCGSTMGLFVLLLGEVLGRKLNLLGLLGILFVLPAGWFGLQWLMEVRGKEMSMDYLAGSDRGKILKTFYDVIWPTFSVKDILFGKGVGMPLHQFVSVDPVFDHYLKQVGEGEIYAFCLHNEPLRLLCDYGLAGLLLVSWMLWKNCTKPVLIMLAVCMTTNSYVYSFSGALIASSFFITKPPRIPWRRNRSRLQSFHSDQSNNRDGSECHSI